MNSVSRIARLFAATLSIALVAGCGGGTSPSQFSLGGTVTGLAAGNTLVLVNADGAVGGTVGGLSGGNSLVVTANGAFIFGVPLAAGSPYAVTIPTQPAGQTCVVSGGTGTVTSAVTSVQVNCLGTVAVGGTVGGLLANNSLVLQNNRGDNTTVRTDGSFVFPTKIAQNSPYLVSVLTQPADETCRVTAASGTTGITDVTNVAVSCTPSVPGTWIWAAGSNATDGIGSYGQLGVAGAGNNPGARDGYAAWTDAAGNFWLFGGFGFDGKSGDGTSYLGDLWRFSPAAQQWTWIAGPSTNSPNVLGVYGQLGVASAGSQPGGRSNGVSWTDAGGNLWLFGGLGWDGVATDGLGDLNDMWMFNPSTQLWSWMKGSSSNTTNVLGIYGNKGFGTSFTQPGARQGAVSWSDTSGNLWLFGGVGLDAQNASGRLNDLWMFNPKSLVWTWVAGSNSTTAGFGGVYGVQGVAAPGNQPGARSGAVSWTDGAGNLWLFGGYGYGLVAAAAIQGELNDLWMFSPTSGLWTWMGGSTATGVVGVYGTQGTASAGNVPGSRDSAVSWIDRSGNLWLFGGNGYGATAVTGQLNDLWMFAPASAQWTWVSGSNGTGASGVYGTQGVAAPANVPGARAASGAWIDSANNLWLFGGFSLPVDVNVYSSDMWLYTP